MLNRRKLKHVSHRSKGQWILLLNQFYTQFHIVYVHIILYIKLQNIEIKILIIIFFYLKTIECPILFFELFSSQNNSNLKLFSLALNIPKLERYR